MPARNHPRKLLVEGETDRSVIACLIEANGVSWPDPPDSPVFIDTRGSVDEILVVEAGRDGSDSWSRSSPRVLRGSAAHAIDSPP